NRNGGRKQTCFHGILLLRTPAIASARTGARGKEGWRTVRPSLPSAALDPGARQLQFQAGLRAHERDSFPGPAPSHAMRHSGIVQALDSSTVAGAAPAFDRLPVYIPDLVREPGTAKTIVTGGNLVNQK